MKKERKNVVVLCPPCGENVGLPTKRGCLAHNATFSVPLAGKMPWKGKRGFLNKATSFTTPLPACGVLPPQGGQITARGFTLIELLVVVLIIGILAAVAIPQYQKAVQKSRLVQLQTMSATLAKAAKVYYLANGVWPHEFNQLDVDIPTPISVNNPNSRDTCASFSNFYCCMSKPAKNARYGQIACGQNDYSFAWVTLFANDEGKDSSMRYCYETQNLGLCKSVPNCYIDNNAQRVITPEDYINRQGFYCRP